MCVFTLSALLDLQDTLLLMLLEVKVTFLAIQLTFMWYNSWSFIFLHRVHYGEIVTDMTHQRSSGKMFNQSGLNEN